MQCVNIIHENYCIHKAAYTTVLIFTKTKIM